MRNNTLHTLKATVLITLIFSTTYIIVQKTLWEGLVFLVFGFLAIYLWLFLQCCWTEHPRIELIEQELKQLKTKK